MEGPECSCCFPSLCNLHWPQTRQTLLSSPAKLLLLSSSPLNFLWQPKPSFCKQQNSVFPQQMPAQDFGSIRNVMHLISFGWYFLSCGCRSDSIPSCLHVAPQNLTMATTPGKPQECQVWATRLLLVCKGVQQVQVPSWAPLGHLSQQSSCPDLRAIKDREVTNHSTRSHDSNRKMIQDLPPSAQGQWFN